MDTLTKEQRSQVMSRIRSTNTRPEVTLRRALWESGLRYRIHYGKERIDIAFPSKRIAIFVDGCFWHRCPQHGVLPKSNKAYWTPKLKNNVARSIAKDERLRRDGWTVFHFWEHEIDRPEKIVRKVIRGKPTAPAKTVSLSHI